MGINATATALAIHANRVLLYDLTDPHDLNEIETVDAVVSADETARDVRGPRSGATGLQYEHGHRRKNYHGSGALTPSTGLPTRGVSGLPPSGLGIPSSTEWRYTFAGKFGNL